MRHFDWVSDLFGFVAADRALFYKQFRRNCASQVPIPTVDKRIVRRFNMCFRHNSVSQVPVVPFRTLSASARGGHTPALRGFGTRHDMAEREPAHVVRAEE